MLQLVFCADVYTPAYRGESKEDEPGQHEVPQLGLVFVWKHDSEQHPAV